MKDDYRDTMFMASLKRRLVRPKKVTTTVYEHLTLEEMKEVMLDRSPVSLWCFPYSDQRPCISIVKRIMPSDGGVYLFYDSWADKTPKLYSWEKLYNALKLAGLSNWRF